MQIFTIADKQNRLVSQSKSLSQKGFAILAGHCSKTFEWACKNPVRYPKFGRKSEFIEKHRQYSIMIIFTVTHVTVISAVFFLFAFVLYLLLLFTSRVQICVRWMDLFAGRDATIFVFGWISEISRFIIVWLLKL